MNKAIVIRPSSTLLWITILTGPVTFAIDMQSRFALVEWACGNHRDWALWAIVVTALIPPIVTALVAWSAFTRLNTLDDLPEHPGTIESGPISVQRARFMAMAGFIISTIIVLTMIANSIPQMFLRSCD